LIPTYWPSSGNGSRKLGKMLGRFISGLYLLLRGSLQRRVARSLLSHLPDMLPVLALVTSLWLLRSVSFVSLMYSVSCLFPLPAVFLSTRDCVISCCALGYVANSLAQGFRQADCCECAVHCILQLLSHCRGRVNLLIYKK